MTPLCPPRSADAWVSRGAMLGRLGREAEELGCLERALELDPQNLRLHLSLGEVLQQSKRPAEALAEAGREGGFFEGVRRAREDGLIRVIGPEIGDVAEGGRLRIEWAELEMPVLREIAAGLAGRARVLVHRDFHFNNLFLLGGTAGQAVVWYTGTFYPLFFLTQTLKVDAQAASPAPPPPAPVEMLGALASIPLPAPAPGSLARRETCRRPA